MKPLLSCLFLCLAFFYSANSAAYNEAMCILIKQEMQQHSHNKNSRKYRSAARDFDRNCRNKPPARTQPKPQVQPQPITVEPPPEQVEPKTDELVTGTEQNTSAIAPQQSTQTIPNTELQTPNTPEPVATVQPDETKALPAAQTNSAEQSTLEPIAEKPAPAQSSNSKQPEIENATVEAVQTEMPVTVTAPATVVSAPSEIPKKLNIMAVILPTVLVCLVVIVAIVVLLRLRQNKQRENINAPPQTPSANPKAPQPSPTEASETHVAATEDEATQPPKKVEPVKAKPAPNSAEFEAAAKATLARIKNATDYNEPQVRDFDPEAKQVKKQRKPVNQPSNVQVNPEPEVQSPPIESSKVAAEPIEPAQPQADLQAPKPPSSPADNSHSELDFKEPAVRTFDPDAPLPVKKSRISPEQVQVTASESTDDNEQTETSNPFANLSLDESWDPNSVEKPTIPEKKRPPKSAELIAAEQRAKDLKTKK